MPIVGARASTLRMTSRIATRTSRAVRLVGLAVVIASVSAFTHWRSGPSSGSLGTVAEADLHTRLVRSEPAKDSVIRVAPTELRLWFSDMIDLAVTRVLLFDGQRAPVRTAALTRADATDAPIIAALAAPLPNGNYSVEWSTSSQDGHPVRGAFRFSVRVVP